MEINWVTVAAQIVNFLVLVWLLNKFLYGPITRAMTARQTRIRERLEDAARTRCEAEEERRKLIAERNELLNTKEKLLTAVRAEADQLQRDLERQARDDVEAQRQAWLSQIETDKEDFLNDVRQRVATEYFALAETAFSELAGETLEKRMVSVFVMRLKSMEESIQRKLKASAEREECVMRIESSFLLGPDERHDINHCIANIMGRDVNIDYAKTDTMIAGIRLRIESQSIEWSINNYLDQLQERLREYFAAAAPHEDRQAAE
jgi:F-type H+-transporting ATPase subunit b